MKKEVAALSLALALTVGMTVPTSAAGGTFSDVPADHWAHAAVEEMASRGVVSGVGENRYAPDNTVSYAEFITMMIRQFYPDQIHESDKYYWSSDRWWSAYLLPAYELGLLGNTDLYDYLFYDPNFEGIIYNGVPSGPGPAPEITPDNTITRYEMAGIIYAVIFDKYGIHSPGYDIRQITDYNDILNNAQGAVAYCYAKGILSGVDNSGAFHGDSAMTRAQAAVVMNRLLHTDFEGPELSPKTANSLELTEDNILYIRGDGSKYEEGKFILKNSPFNYGVPGGSIEFDNPGYSTLTFTVTAYEKTHGIGVGSLDSRIIGDTRLNLYQEAGTPQTYTVDISGIKRVSIGVSSGITFCDALIENAYLNK